MDYALASQMDWMQRDSQLGCGVIMARSVDQQKLIRDVVDVLSIPYNGVNYVFKAAEANRTDRHKAYVCLFMVRAKTDPRGYVKGVPDQLGLLDPLLTSEHYSAGHPNPQNEYIKMTIFVSDKLRKFIERSHHTLPALGGVLRVDFQNEIHVCREQAAKEAAEKAQKVAEANAAETKVAAGKPSGAQPPANPASSSKSVSASDAAATAGVDQAMEGIRSRVDKN